MRRPEEDTPAGAAAASTSSAAKPKAGTVMSSEDEDEDEDEEDKENSKEEEEEEEATQEEDKEESEGDPNQPTLFAFVQRHMPPASHINKKRKVALSRYEPKKVRKMVNVNNQGRGVSNKKNGGRSNDVSQETMSKRVSEWPGHMLKIVGKQLWCGVCRCNLGSSKQSVARHCSSVVKHVEGMKKEVSGGAETWRIFRRPFTTTKA
eukprot:scaffold176642_cov24-Tisochrysis_lutea.AAC.1